MNVLGVVRGNGASQLRDHSSFALFHLVLVFELVYPKPLCTSEGVTVSLVTPSCRWGCGSQQKGHVSCLMEQGELPSWGYTVAMGISGSHQGAQAGVPVQWVPVMGSVPSSVHKDGHSDGASPLSCCSCALSVPGQVSCEGCV